VEEESARLSKDESMAEVSLGGDRKEDVWGLATYLGHVNLSGTQRYLHLTAELFPEITARADAAFGDVIPRRIEP
jgi:hypothetical protein